MQLVAAGLASVAKTKPPPPLPGCWSGPGKLNSSQEIRDLGLMLLVCIVSRFCYSMCLPACTHARSHACTLAGKLSAQLSGGTSSSLRVWNACLRLVMKAN